jgi:hypothetical protein
MNRPSPPLSVSVDVPNNQPTFARDAPYECPWSAERKLCEGPAFLRALPLERPSRHGSIIRV